MSSYVFRALWAQARKFQIVPDNLENSGLVNLVLELTHGGNRCIFDPIATNTTNVIVFAGIPVITPQRTAELEHLNHSRFREHF